MNKCFVIQPFDRGKFDKRYDDVLVPAIKAADLEPYRVDRDPSVAIPIEEIQSGIESSQICLADITTDNPNVWFELGYAIAARRDVVLICSIERTSKFPFDVQHRTVIQYSSESPRDFQEMSGRIKQRLCALLEKSQNLKDVSQMSSVASLDGLEQHEIAALIAAAEQTDEPTNGVRACILRESMERVGFAKIAKTLATTRLISIGMLEAYEEQENFDTYTAYRVTDDGMNWLLVNRDKLKLRVDPSQVIPKPATAPQTPCDDIPF